MSETVLLRGARKLDARGEVDDFWMLVAGPLITQAGTGRPPAADRVVDVSGGWLVPGFLDLHGHGGGGRSFDEGGDGLAAALATHRAHGTTRSVISLVAAPLERLEAQLAAIADLADADPLVLGAHLEGPFLAANRRGAHDLDALLDPQPEVVDQLLGAARNRLVQVTLAPELDGAFEAIDVLVEAGVTVAIGHTDADYDLARTAFDRGARLLTHAFNGMPGLHHRAPGPVLAALEDERVVLELILDGLHVHPSLAAFTLRSAPGRVALVTDAMAAAGSVDGDYRLGERNVAVRNGLAMLRGTTTLAGSTLMQDRALRMGISAGLPPAQVVAALTTVPARVLGLDHRFGMLAPGFAADAVLLDHEWRVRQVWADGVVIAGA